MKRLLAILMISFIGLGMASSADAARRLGGGKSVGMQRQAAPPREAVKAPAQQAPQPAAAPGAAAKPAMGGMGRWLAPLAAFGLGAALMSMFGGSMMAGALGNILMLLLLAGAVFFAIKMFRRKSAAASPAPFQYAGAGAPAPMDTLPPTSAGLGSAAQGHPAERPAYP
ncbi:MAG: Tim44 domain-containing protein, partial [Burkholderiales bacterium]|nr:Tim44 domain-containing protein [Burkholderiales bacterium]